MALTPFYPTQSARLLRHNGSLNVDSYEGPDSLDRLDRTLSIVPIDAFPPDHPDRGEYIDRIVYLHAKSFQFTNSVELVDNAIEKIKRAGKPEEPSAHAQHLASLALFYSIRFNCLGSGQDLDSTIALYREASEVVGAGHPHRPYHLGLYAM